jgi:succinate dehydrogenase / fumarate reductase membrane anchor subunit
LEDVVKSYTKHPVGAHYGLGEWLLQRFTAFAMAIYTVVLLAYVLASPPASAADWKSLFAGGFFRLATMLFFLALLYHAWVGMRDVFMDYVKPDGVRLALSALVGLVLFGYLVWSAAILWGR